MENKEIIFVVDGTSAMGPYWEEMLNGYLEIIVKYIAGTGVETEASSSTSNTTSFSLVTFSAEGRSGEYMTIPSGWTKDGRVFLHWLSSIPFSGGVAANDAALAQGLSDAFIMYRGEAKRHCVLISASSPSPLPTPVHHPSHVDYSSASWSEIVAQTLSQSGVSLSVLSPQKLPGLQAIYDAANVGDPPAHEPPADYTRNPNHLILLSEKFPEAIDALEHRVAEALSSIEAKLFPGPSRPSSPSELDIGSALIYQDLVDLIFQPHFDESKQESSSAGLDRETLIDLESSRYNKPGSSVSSEQQYDVDDLEIHVDSRGIILSPVKSRQPSSLSGSSRTPWSSGFPKPLLGSSQSGAKATKDDQSSLKRSFGSAFDMARISSESGYGSIESIAQDSRDVLHNVSPSSMLNLLPSASQGNFKYVKAWEWGLMTEIQGGRELVCKLVAYRKESSPSSLTANWPKALHISKLMPPDFTNALPTEVAVDYMIFEAASYHSLLDQFHEQKLCANVKLPSQTLILSGSTQPGHLIGTLYPGEFAVDSSQSSSKAKQRKGKQVQHPPKPRKPVH